MEKKYKVGDFVRRILSGEIVKIEVIKEDWIAYREERLITGACPMEEVEPVDPKTAFLSDLAAVLRKHNAVINVGLNDYADPAEAPRIDMDICFVGSKRGISIEDVLDKTITADNIMDYGKE